jgi:succinate dehydrogenase / fumarate reductase cytochrome b subunit
MARNTARPLSPHLTIWRWGPHMLVSILHRGTGIALTVAGLFLLTWWLLAIAGGAEAYRTFGDFIGWSPFGIPLIQVGLFLLTWSFFQHTASGVRHLVMDIGAGFELRTNKLMAYATMIASGLLTVAVWALFLTRAA